MLHLVHRGIAGVADRLMARESPLRRVLTPAYATALQLLAGERGMSWAVGGDVVRIDPRFRHLFVVEGEAPVYALLRREVRPGAITMNVGANVGLYVLLLAGKVGRAGHVIAFEPNVATATVLRRHVRMNGFEGRVTIDPSAVGVTSGHSSLFDTREASGLSRLGAAYPAFIGDRPPASTLVPVVSIDDYCRVHSADPDWLVIDVEGHEIEVLRGASETFGRRPGLTAVVEVHPNTWRSLDEGRARLFAVLNDLGLKYSPLTGQRDPLGEYGHILVRAGS